MMVVESDDSSCANADLILDPFLNPCRAYLPMSIVETVTKLQISMFVVAGPSTLFKLLTSLIHASCNIS